MLLKSAFLFLFLLIALPAPPRLVMDVSLEQSGDSVIFAYYREETETFIPTRYLFYKVPAVSQEKRVDLPPGVAALSLLVKPSEGGSARVKGWTILRELTFFGLKVPIQKSELIPATGVIFSGVLTTQVKIERISAFFLRALDAFLWTLILSLGFVSIGRRQAPTSKNLVLKSGCALLIIGGLSWYFLREKPGPVWERYKLHLVDRNGFSLSGARGGVYVQFNPFTSYRNARSLKAGYYCTDENGWRVSSKKKNGPHAIVLGSSAAFGWGIEKDEETFTSKLNELNPDIAFHNAAVISWHSAQELSEMIHYGDQLKPKLYVSFNGFNEIFYRHPEGSGFNPVIQNDIENRLKKLLFYQRTESDRVFPVPEKGQVPVEKIIQNYLNHIEKMDQFAKSRGARYLLVIQPDLSCRRTKTDHELDVYKNRNEYLSFKGNERFEENWKMLISRAMAFANSKGIPVLDLNQDKRITDSKEAIFLDWIHPSPHGHGLIANIINEEIRKLPISWK